MALLADAVRALPRPHTLPPSPAPRSLSSSLPTDSHTLRRGTAHRDCASRGPLAVKSSRGSGYSLPLENLRWKRSQYKGITATVEVSRSQNLAKAREKPKRSVCRCSGLWCVLLNHVWLVLLTLFSYVSSRTIVLSVPVISSALLGTGLLVLGCVLLRFACTRHRDLTTPCVCARQSL